MKATKIDLVMQHINQQINNRSLMPGSRLPSVRALAERLTLSVSTVVEAYERLASQGLIESKTGSGFFVAGPLAPLSMSQFTAKIDRNIDPLWISRQSLEAQLNVLKPGCGWLPDDWMPYENIRKALRKVSKANSEILSNYSTPLGLLALRELLSRRILVRGVEANPNQILLTDSGTQAIDLICRYFLKPNDVVLVDDPCYFNFHALLKAHRANIVSVPYTAQGPQLEIFEQVLAEHNPRLYITNSGIHNPTGATLSPSTAHHLLKLIDSTNLIIIEDDIFADFELNPAPRLAALDGLQRVIQIGSFSKTISASLRCGYIAVKNDWVENLVNLKIATSFGGGRLSAEMVLLSLKDSGYRKHMDMVRTRLASEMLKVIRKLEAINIQPWIIPQAGMFLWCKLPKGLDAGLIAQACLKQGVVLAPGNAFSQSLSAKDFLRFNVVQCNEDRIFEVLAEVMKQFVEAPQMNS